MTSNGRDQVLASIGAIALVLLPLLGVMIAGEPLARYTEFPPQTQYVQHADFSWIAFVLVALAVVVVLLPFEIHVRRSRGTVEGHKKAKQTFPWWGWLGVLLGIVAWILAWTRFGWFEPLQRFTFSPLWFAYIIVVNAVTFGRTGHCMLKDRPRYLLSLFLLSAAFWWYFEYLNRFVQNWHYEAAAGLTAWQYFIFATLPFSTVLPAVLGTYEMLDSVPRAGVGLDKYFWIRTGKSRIFPGVVLAVSCVGLALIGTWPDYLFPLLWVSPLLIITSVQALLGKETIFAGIRRGKWRKLYLLAMSALICGFFWEMWNSLSFARWIYTVPLVGRFKVFEMPILGFAGYLPFGLECAVIAELMVKRRNQASISSSTFELQVPNDRGE